MRTLSGHQTRALIAVGVALALSSFAWAQDGDAAGPILIPPQSSVFNQNSMSLPSAPVVSGQDVVRGADGTTCQSAVASGGPYVDVGVLQSQDFFARESAALYGRVVFPLGKRSRRVDCTHLYRLEIERMRMELELLRMGTTLGDTLAVSGEAVMPIEDEAPPGGGVVVPPRGERAQRVAVATQVAAPPPTRRQAEEAAPSPVPAPKPERAPSNETPPRERAASGPPMALSFVDTLPTEQPPEVYFVQTGAFSTTDSAMARLNAAASFSGRSDGALKPLQRNGTTLFRTLFGPMSRREAEDVCSTLPYDCFIAEL
ncbi:MAG: SPOR domain-containing protein [Pseudomonadota bacterium]